jgi:hypothetical protein
MRRIGSRAIGVALALVAVLPSSARASGVWDPNEPIRRLDMRWVGVFDQADGRLRVTITFHERVRLRWFDVLRFAELTSMVVPFRPAAGQQADWFAVFGKRHGRVRAQMCAGGSGCGEARVKRPDPFTIRARFSALGRPPTGWVFRGRSTRGGWDGAILDRTPRGTIT